LRFLVLFVHGGGTRRSTSDTVRTYVYRLRPILDDMAVAVIESTGSGSRLTVGDGAFMSHQRGLSLPRAPHPLSSQY
jgi:hypothetical protein